MAEPVDQALLEGLAALGGALEELGAPAMVIDGIAVIARGVPKADPKGGRLRYHWDVMRRSAADILTLLEQNGETIRGYGVRRLGLFGSAAHGAASEQSDLDFVVEFERKSFDAYMDLKAYLETLLGRRVDLVVVEAIKPRLCDTILGEALHAWGL